MGFSFGGGEEVAIANCFFLHGVVVGPPVGSSGEGDVGSVKRVASVVLGLLEDGRLVVFIFVQVVQHVLLLLRDEKAVVLLVVDSALGFPALGLGFLLDFWAFFCEVVKAFNKLLGEEGFVLIKAVFLGAEDGGFDVLYFELDGFGGDGGDVDVEVVAHIKLL